MNTLDELRNRLETERTARARVFTELENLRAREQADGPSEGVTERVGNLNRALANADDRIAELEAEYGRHAYLDRLAGDPRNLIEGVPPAPDRGVPREKVSEAREQALRTVERHADVMEDGAAERADRLIRHDDPHDSVSRYLEAVGSDAYRSAFAKLMADPQHGHLRYSAEEVEAVRVVSALQAERAMNITTGSAGGFALPFTLDPTVMLSSAGQQNPIRQLARVVTVNANEWRGISSDGVTAAFSAEAAPMTDGTPTLVQPTITCRRWTAFVPYSWELGMDWPSLETELVRLISDGRDALETSVFFSGTSSSNQPQGVVTGLGASQLLLTGGTASLTAADWWSLKAAIPPRFAANLTFAAPSPLLDRTFRLVPNAATSEPALMPTRDGSLMGRPVAEWSFNSGTTTATGATLALAGDFSAGYVIADRLGLSAVPIPALFNGNTTGGIAYPTGQSGLAVWGRTGGAVVNAAALRVLVAR